MSKIFKNLISMLLCSVLLLSTVAVGASATDITYGDYGIFRYMINYAVGGGTLSIVGCDTSASGHIVVPDTIEGYPVSGIGGGAFMNCSGITEITIGESVQAIDSSPFAGCSNLKTINFNAVDCEGCLGDDAVPIGFGESMIGTGNYTGNNTVTTVNFGSRVSSISPLLLYGFSQLKQITIPESVTSIGEFAFLNCNSVETLTYNAVNAELEDNWFCFAESAEDVGFGSKSLKTINIGENVSVLPIFEDLKYLETVNYNAVNASTDSILLYNCSCSSVNIGENVKYIPSLCYECTGIDEITIPEGVERIAMFAFNLCNVKTVNYNAVNAQIIIPDDIGVLDDMSKALYGCMIAFDSDDTAMSSISSINIGTGVRVIPSGILGILPELTNISIPASVETIEGLCFLFSQKLGAIDVDALNSSYKNVDGVLFTADGKTLVKYPEGKKSIKDYSIPEGTQTVSDYAFTGSELEVVRIPASVKHIGTGAFACGYTSLDSDYYGENGFDPAYATLRDVYYSGSEAQFNALYNPDDANEELSAAALHFLNDEPVGGTYGVLTYEISNGEVTITGLTNNANGVLIIPETIEGCPVTKIGEETGGFGGGGNITGITFPSSVIYINDSAVYSFHSLETITVADGNPVYYSSGNCLIRTEGKVLVLGCKNSIIPDDGSVTVIGGYSFSGCTGLTNITIPDSVTSIDYSAFSGCTGLTSITFGKGVKYIYGHPLSGCTGLTSITVDTGNPVYHSSGNCLIETESKTLVAGCKNSVIPDDGSVTVIGGYSFSGCTGLTNITIPESVTDIGSYAFYNSTSLTSITIPDSIKSIDYQAFLYTGYYNDNDNWIDNALYIDNCLIEARVTGEYTIKQGAKFIADGAFATYKNMIYNNNELNSIIISDSVTSIDYGALSGCTGLTSITFGKGVKYIYGHSLSGCTGLTSITVDTGNPVYHSVGNCVIETESKALVAGCKNSVIPSDGSVTSIGYGAFSGCTGLTSITIPESVTNIDNWVFEGCTGLTSITIPDSVTSIGGGAFSGCTGLTSVTIGNNVKSIEYYAFDGCTSLNSVYYQGTQDEWDSLNIDEFGNEALINANVYLVDGTLACNHILEKEYIVEPTLTGNGVYSEVCSLCGKFKGHSYEYPLGEATGNEDDFIKEYNGILYMTVCDASDGERKEIVVVGCSDEAGENVIIPESINGVPVTSIYGDAPMLFGINTKMKTLTISEGVTEIDDGAFGGCYNLEEIVLPDSVKVISDNAFSGCVGLKKITLGSGVIYIGDGAFATSVSEEMLNEIEEDDEFDNLKEAASEMAGHPIDDFDEAVDYLLESFDDDFIMQLQILQIAQYKRVYDYYKAGNLDSHLSDVYYRGTQEEWVDIIIDSGNNDLLNADIHFLGDEPINGTYGPLSYEISNGEVIITGCDKNASGNIEIPSTIEGLPVTAIGNEAFFNCTKITGIAIPETVVALEKNWTDNFVVFLGCASLETITVEEGNPVYHSSGNCLIETNTKTLVLGCKNSVIPDDGSVTVIGQCAFNDCVGLTEFAVPEGITTIDDLAFCLCSNLESITLPDSLTEIGECSFTGCVRLVNVTVPENVTEIGVGSFGYCTELETVELPESLEKIGSWAFSLNFDIDSDFIDYVNECEANSAGEYELIGEILTLSVAKYWLNNPCAELKNVYYRGTQEEWADIIIDSGNDDLLNADIHFLGDEPAHVHTPGDWETVMEPTETAPGRAVKKCTECGEILEEKELSKLKVIKDNSTGIELVYNGDNYENDVNINVVELFDGKAFNIVNTKTGTATQKVYDVTLLVNGEETQPNGKIKVKIPLPEGYDAAYTFVYHVNTETGRIEKMTATYENGFMVFETDHFSYYAVVEENPTASAKLKVRSSATVDYRSKVNITATASGVPEGFFVAIYDGKTLLKKGDNKKVVCTPEDGNGKPLELKADKTYTVKIIDANGNVQKDANGKDLTAKVEIKVKQNFFNKLIAFFKGLFRLLPIVEIKP